MKCKYLTVRTRQYQKYKFCRLKKQVILNECENCLFKQYKLNKPINKKSDKLKQLEKKRDSKIIKKGKCQYCGKYCDKLDPHEIYGGSNRKRSIENNFIILLCRECHSNEKIIADIRVQKQKEFEKTHTRNEFINIIGKSYIN